MFAIATSEDTEVCNGFSGMRERGITAVSCSFLWNKNYRPYQQTMTDHRPKRSFDTLAYSVRNGACACRSAKNHVEQLRSFGRLSPSAMPTILPVTTSAWATMGSSASKTMKEHIENMDKANPTFQEFSAYWQLSDEM